MASSEIPNSNIVDAKIRDALTNHPTKKDVDDAMKSKQDALSTSQTNAVNSGVTKELVEKLKTIEGGAQKNPDLTDYAKTADVLPRYQFTPTEVVDGVVTIAPFMNVIMPSDGTAFEVAVGEGNDAYMRDCVLVVECGETAPTITWGANFHPRTDAETDFACVAGVRNVYWITEYAPGEFVVAGWQETTGGNAE